MEKQVRTKQASRLLTFASVLAVVAIVAGACGSSSKNSGADSNTTTKSSGTKADASLSPVTIGMINQEAGAVGTYPEVSAAAKAAVEYVNNDLGGVDKHPLKLDLCTTDGTVASSQKCAQQMVTDKVSFVQGGLDNNSQAWYSILQPAGVPVLGGIPVAGGDFNSTDASYFIGGGATSYPGLAAYIMQFMKSAKSVAIIANDTPGAAAALPLITKPLDSAGVKHQEIKVPASQADWLAPFASAKDADAVLVLVGSANCISLAKARYSQQSSVPMVSVSACYSQKTIDGAGAPALNGWTVTQNYDDPQGDSADAKLYQAQMAKYAGPTANLGGFAPVAFSDVLTVYNNALKPLGYDGSIVGTKVSDKVRAAGGGKVFMGPSYKCGAADSPYPAVCNYQTHFFHVKDGKLTQPTPFIDLIPTIKLSKS